MRNAAAGRKASPVDTGLVIALLPADWSATPYGGRQDMVVLERPRGSGGGYATIDFARRVFATGCGTPHVPVTPDKKYRGRGWQQQLVADAVNHLNAVMA